MPLLAPVTTATCPSRLNKSMIDIYWDKKGGGLFFSGKGNESLITRSKDIYDGAIPSGNSVAALNLLRLGRATGDIDIFIDATVEKFGGIDICINNASAISLTGTEATPMKRYDLMNQINARGTYLTSKLCIPHLKNAENPHVLMLSPPLDMSPKWFGGHVAYTMAKFGMSMCVLGMAEEFRNDGIAFNALWPRTAIATAAVKFALGGDAMMQASRTPDILSDAAHLIFTKPSREFTGNFIIDDTFLYENGVTDFEKYRVDPAKPLAPDFFVPDDSTPPPGVAETMMQGML